MSTTTDPDSAVRVVVTPAQSSYFAGEPFSVTITFTNTRTPSSSTHPRPSHKRGAHSISSAPLARPPTSPGTPPTPRPTTPQSSSRLKSGNWKPVRKGLIGKKELTGNDVLPELMEQRRKKLLGRSLSVNITPRELENQLSEVADNESTGSAHPNTPPYLQRFQEGRSAPTSPRISSPLARSASLTLSSSHPHVRKNSLLDGQVQSPLDISPSPTPPPFTPSASNSTFSLALDTISETSPSPYSSTLSLSQPFPQTPHTATFPGVNPYIQRSLAGGHSRRHSLLGLGYPSSSSSTVSIPQPPRTATGSSFPHSYTTELILYAYAQLTGTLTISQPAPGTSSTEQQQTLQALRSSLLKRPVVGGGSMDITSSVFGTPVSRITTTSRPHPPRSHSRSSSLSNGLLGFLSPSSVSTPNLTSIPTSPRIPGHRPRSASVLGFVTGGGDANGVDPEIPLPTFEVQPAMLAVDLVLAPGESKSYTYTIALPENLPPTYKGRLFKFSYEFVVGTCRAASIVSPPSSTLGPSGANSTSRVMKVPIRVYNNASVEKPSVSYDLFWPVTKRVKPTADSVAQVVEVADSLTRIPKTVASREGSFQELQEYARELVATFDGTEVKSDEPEKMRSIESTTLFQSGGSGLREREEEGVLTGCREAVEILTRNPKKISYDVNKDGVKVAVLTFTKPAYRLGETVMGVVELNEPTGRSRVLQMSAMLETQEALPQAISSSPGSRQLRRVHAEHHTSFLSSTLRTTFSLDIPSDASPAFKVKMGEGEKGGQGRMTSGGLEWKVRICLLVCIASPASSIGMHGVRMKGLVRDGKSGEWGSCWKAGSRAAPMEKVVRTNSAGAGETNRSVSWSAYFVSTLLGSVDEEEETVGDEEEGGEDDFGGGETGWRDVKVETVECEVPMRVLAGNTVFKAMEVTFDL